MIINLWLLISSSISSPNLNTEKDESIYIDSLLDLPKLKSHSNKYTYFYGVLGLNVSNYWSFKSGYINEANLILGSASAIYLKNCEVLHFDKKLIAPFSKERINIYYFISVPTDTASIKILQDLKVSLELKDNKGKKIEHTGLNVNFRYEITQHN